MKILILAKLDQQDEIVQNFANTFCMEDVEIDLLNIVQIPSEIPLKMNGEVIDVCTEYDLTKYYELQKKNYTQLTNYLTDFPLVKRSCFVGNALHIVKWYIQENKIDLVISGGHVTTKGEDVFSSSFANHLLQTLSVPYLSIKSKENNLSIDTIAIVREFNTPAKHNLEWLKKIQEKFNSKILLVKVNMTKNSSLETEMSNNMKRFAELNQLHNFDCITIHAKDKESAILELIKDRKIDLLSIGHLERNLINTFLRGDLRADILNHVQVPVYIYN
jgi:nucleotide-binding universal stress UspA family protein